MNDADLEILADLFDATPSTIEEFRNIVRALVRHVESLDPLEADIIEWDAEGRNPDEFERIRGSAWAFSETGDAAGRARLFAGFVSSEEGLDGYGADYLIDFALAAGVAADDVQAVLLSRGIS